MGKTKNKVILYGRHFAYIDSDFMESFLRFCKVSNFASWLRKQAKRDFDLEISDENSISQLDKLVAQHYYSDKTEWLREKMRLEMAGSRHGLLYRLVLTDDEDADPVGYEIIRRIARKAGVRGIGADADGKSAIEE
jgi:hypothetical protein